MMIYDDKDVMTIYDDDDDDDDDDFDLAPLPPY